MNNDHNHQQQRTAWEGLGGPVAVERPNFDGIDPTLDSCCRREEEDVRKASAKRKALQRHDVVAARERSRRNLVTLEATGESGCRCCYDPTSDGGGAGGDYRALIELRAEREASSLLLESEKRQQEEEEQEEKKTGSYAADRSGDDDDDDDSDDEYDYLLGDDLPAGQHDDRLREYEEQRRAELEEAVAVREIAVQHGYGVHRPMHPGRILRAAGLGLSDSGVGRTPPPPAVVVHLVDPDSRGSASLDLFLEKLARRPGAAGTKFTRSGGRSTLLVDADLASRVLPRSQLHLDRDIPALVVVRDGVVTSVLPGLGGLLDDDGAVVEGAVRDWLDRAGALLSEPPPLAEMCRIRPEEDALVDYVTAAAAQPHSAAGEADLFDCGVPDCQKAYRHEHVGIHNEQQRGVVVSEEDIIVGGGGDAAGDTTTATTDSST